MAKKLDSIVELAAQKTREISANSGNYMAFLTTAAHNFKYDFRDQLLIYSRLTSIRRTDTIKKNKAERTGERWADRI